MAGVDAIINQILKDAREQAAQIADAAQEQIRESVEKNERLVLLQTEAINAKAEMDCIEEEKRYRALSDLEFRKEELRIKRVCLEESFSLAQQKILSMDEEQYGKVMFGLLQKCGAGGGRVFYAKRDETIFNASFFENAKKQIDSEIRPGGILESARSGFVLMRGDIEIDCSIETILNQTRSELESNVAQMLFVR